jgi:ornithine cyclodeaminase/alanine dehydrogenase-like protein (mu-crystallin family)
MIVINENLIRKVISFEEIMASLEEAFLIYESGNFSMPDRIHVENKKNTLLYMPCFTDEIFGTKSLTIFPENSKVNKPVIDGFMTLHDPATGSPLAIIDGKILTALRTGGVGGVGCRYLSDENASVLGIIGAGVQGIYQTIFISKVRPIKKVRIFDLNTDTIKTFVKFVKEELPHLEIVICDTTEEVLTGADIVVTATNSNKPVLPNKTQLLKGKLFIGIGSYKPSMREFPDKLYPLLNKVYTDTTFACEESGDLHYPLKNNLITSDQISTIGSIIAKKTKILDETMFFKSVGMALLDLLVAKAIYQKVIGLKKP